MILFITANIRVRAVLKFSLQAVIIMSFYILGDCLMGGLGGSNWIRLLTQTHLTFEWSNEWILSIFILINNIKQKQNKWLKMAMSDFLHQNPQTWNVAETSVSWSVQCTDSHTDSNFTFKKTTMYVVWICIHPKVQKNILYWLKNPQKVMINDFLFIKSWNMFLWCFKSTNTNNSHAWCHFINDARWVNLLKLSHWTSQAST